MILHKRVSSALAYRVDSRLDYRIVRSGKGELGDNHVLQRITGYVHALPETRGSQQYCSRIFSETVEHYAPGKVASLDEQFVIVGTAELFEFPRHRFEHRVAGQQHEASSLGFLHVVCDGFRCGRNELLEVVGISKLRFDVQFGLFSEIERAGQQHFVGIVEPQAVAYVVEPVCISPGRCQRCAGEHHAGDVVEQQ